MMGPLAGISDPVFWFYSSSHPWSLVHHLLHLVTLLVPFSSSLDGILIRMAFLWYAQEFSYKELDLRLLKTCLVVS